jgi:uncharacterized UBP type Zn finger protein
MKISPASGSNRPSFAMHALRTHTLRRKIISLLRMDSSKMEKKLAYPGQIQSSQCSHLDQIQAVTPSAAGCTDCLRTGDRWVHLRICLSCGYVGCCNDSKNKHATRHFQATSHPLIQSYESGENWVWCYLDQTVMEP